MVTAEVKAAEYYTTVETGGVVRVQGWRWRRDCRHYRQLLAAESHPGSRNRLKWARIGPGDGNPVHHRGLERNPLPEEIAAMRGS